MAVDEPDGDQSSRWVAPLQYRESMVSYLVRIAGQDIQPRSGMATRALNLLRSVISPTKGWTDVNVTLQFFSRTLVQVSLINYRKFNSMILTYSRMSSVLNNYSHRLALPRKFCKLSPPKRMTRGIPTTLIS